MKKDPNNTTINCTPDTKDVIKIVAKFTKTSQRNILKSLLINLGVMPSDGTLNVFNNWDSETLIRYKVFAEEMRKQQWVADQKDEW